MNQWGQQQWQGGYYPPQPYANIYLPPGQQYAPGWSAPVGPNATVNSSHPYRTGSKYANLHPILAADTTLLRLDLTKRPQNEITAQTYYTHRHLSATWSNANHMRLFSKHFPWSVDIIVNQGPVTCSAIWEGLYSALQEPIEDSEWGLTASDKRQRDTIEKAAKKRIGTDSDKRLRRIDWLGETVYFRGLEKNEEFEKARLLPGTQPCKETWMVKMG